MVPGCRQRTKLQKELDCRRELLKKSIKDCVSVRDYYISRNEGGEKELQRLFHIKEDLTYLKDVLLQDLHKSNINAGKRKILFNKRLEEFQEKSCNLKMQLEKLPDASKLQELVQSNENLLAEYLKWNEILVSVKREYSKIFCILENNLKMEIIEFVKELSQMMKTRVP